MTLIPASRIADALRRYGHAGPQGARGPRGAEGAPGPAGSSANIDRYLRNIARVLVMAETPPGRYPDPASIKEAYRLITQ